MKNYFNNSSESEILDHHLDGVFMAQISEFVIMNVLAVLISLLIVSTNSLVIYWIIKAQAKSARSDFSFIYLSVSNIGLGLFSVPIQCVTLYYFKYLQNRPLIMIILGSFSRYFPYTFSCIFTAVIAVDRVFVIILDRRYKDLVTLKILKIVAVILFLCSATNSSIITIHNTQSKRFSTRWVNGSSADYSMVAVAFFCLKYSLYGCCYTGPFIYFIFCFKTFRSQAIKEGSRQQWEKTDKDNYRYMYQSVNLCYSLYSF